MKQQQLEKLQAGFADPLPIGEARRRWRGVREGLGLRPTTPRLLTHPSGNTKLNKGQQYGLCLIPHRLSGYNVCPHSTKQCRQLCINSSGRGKMPYVQEGRLARTRFLFQEPGAFACILQREIMRLPTGAGLRLNVFSDLEWEVIAPQLFEMRPDLRFYEYTKFPIESRSVPKNLHLTYSASEKWSEDDIVSAVSAGHNVAIPFNLRRSAPMPTSWRSLPLIDGDTNDARYADPKGVIVGLRAKGKAVRSSSPFVRQLQGI